MSYETAPATILLATRCCVCNRPLVDAISVELGIGPDCREKYGYNIAVEPEAREAANKLVHKVACGVDAAELQQIVLTLKVYGFGVLADTLVDRKAEVKVTAPQPDVVAIDTPYRADFVAALKAAVPYRWRKWDATLKVWLVSAVPEAKNAAWRVLKLHFKGSLGVAPDGKLFAI